MSADSGLRLSVLMEVWKLEHSSSPSAPQWASECISVCPVVPLAARGRQKAISSLAKAAAAHDCQAVDQGAM